MPGNKPRSQHKKKRRGFYGVRPQEKNRATDSDVVKEKNMAPSLSRSSNTGNTNFNCSARNDAKDNDNVSKGEIEYSMLAYNEVQEDTLSSKDKRLIKINLVLLDDAVNAYLTWRNLQLSHLLHVVTLKDTNSFVQMH